MTRWVTPDIDWYVVSHFVRIFDDWSAVVRFVEYQDVRREPTTHATRADIVKHYATQAGCLDVGPAAR